MSSECSTLGYIKQVSEDREKLAEKSTARTGCQKEGDDCI